MVTIPLGCLAGGLMMLGEEFTLFTLLLNIVPVLVVSILIAAGLKFIPSAIIKGFSDRYSKEAQQKFKKIY